MTDWLADTPVMAVMYCPGCEPGRDPTREVLDVRYCADHEPKRAGLDDDAVVVSAWISGSSEVGGEDNAKWCALFHRKAQP